MKRDARIGLAIVLVLGLSVTLLVARSLHKRANELEAENDQKEQDAAMTERNEHAHAEQVRMARLNDNTSSDPTVANNATDESPEEAAQRQALARWNIQHGLVAPVATAQPMLVSQPIGNNVHSGAIPVSINTPVKNGNCNVDNGQMGDLPGGNSPLGMSGMDTPPAPVAEPKVTGYLYKCVAGDNIRKVSMKVYGDSKYAPKIAEANKGSSLEIMKAGQPVKIPLIKGVEPKMELSKLFAKSETGHDSVAQSHTTTAHPLTMSAVSHVESHDNSSMTYQVKPGDTLAKIASATLGSSGPKSIKKLQDANPGLDPRKLKVGQTLKVPAAQ